MALLFLIGISSLTSGEKSVISLFSNRNESHETDRFLTFQYTVPVVSYKGHGRKSKMTSWRSLFKKNKNFSATKGMSLTPNNAYWERRFPVQNNLSADLFILVFFRLKRRRYKTIDLGECRFNTFFYWREKKIYA